MRRRCRSVVLAFGLVIGSGSAAHALNFCFNPGTVTPSLAVAEKFKKPALGSCSPINGIDIGDPAIPRRLVTGTACLNSAGDTLLVAYTVHIYTYDPGSGPIDTPPLSVAMTLPYPSLANGVGFVNLDNSGVGGGGSHNAHANPCIPQRIPIP
jgi:hypothetical protein